MLRGAVKREEGETYGEVKETRTIRNTATDMPQQMETGKKNKSGKHDTDNWEKPTKIHENENRWKTMG